jgi:hypothetical protein
MHPVLLPARVDYRRLWWVTPLAGLAAALLNALLYLLARAAGALPLTVLLPNLNEPLGLRLVILNSLLPALLAGPLLALLGKWSKHPVRTFRLLAAIVFLLSLVTPFGIAQAPLPMVLVLELMHLVAAGVITYALTVGATSPGPSRVAVQQA